MNNREILESIAVAYNNMIHIYDPKVSPCEQAAKICELASKIDKRKLSRFECIAFKTLMLAVSVAGGTNEESSGDFTVCWDKYHKKYVLQDDIVYPSWADTETKRDKFFYDYIIGIYPKNVMKMWEDKQTEEFYEHSASAEL